VELLPEDESAALHPPTDEVLREIVERAEEMRAIAPWFPELITFALESGLRKGEIFSLVWNSVDYSLGPNGEGAIRVEEQLRNRLVGGKKWTPKNRRTRVVPLSPTARATLDHLRAEMKPKGTDLVFPNEEGAPYERVQLGCGGSSAWRILKESMGYSVRFHDLRHRAAVTWLSNGIPMATVSAWLGHSDVNLTVKRYGRFGVETHIQWVALQKIPKPSWAPSSPPSLQLVRGGSPS
jgi:integrase